MWETTTNYYNLHLDYPEKIDLDVSDLLHANYIVAWIFKPDKKTIYRHINRIESR